MEQNRTIHDFPVEMPAVEITPLLGGPAEIECRELRWWFIRPEPNQRSLRAEYEYPSRQLKDVVEMEDVGSGKVHGESCRELRYREYSPESDLTREAFAYGAIQDGHARWLGWWNLHDNDKLVDWTDGNFDADWRGSPLRLVDVGRFRWLGEHTVEERSLDTRDDSVDPIDPIVAGVCRLRLGDTEFRCTRVLDLPPPGGYRDILCEGFLNEAGETLLFRRYNSANYVYGPEKGGWDLKLSDSPSLTINGVGYYLWCDYLSARALEG